MPDIGINDLSVLKLSNIVNISVAAVVEKDGKYLMITEKDGWNFPSGKVNLDESPLEAAKREAKEETGMEVQPVGVVSFYYYRTRGNSYDKRRDRVTIRINLKCDYIKEDKNQKSEQETEVRWLEKSDITKIVTERGFRNWIAEALAKDILEGKCFPLDILFVRS